MSPSTTSPIDDHPTLNELFQPMRQNPFCSITPDPPWLLCDGAGSGAEDGSPDRSGLASLVILDPILPDEAITADTGLIDDALNGITQPLAEDIVRELSRVVGQFRPTRALKLEVPALRSNNETDYREFIQDVIRPIPMDQAILSQARLPVEPDGENEDAGLDFPANSASLATAYTRDIESEDLESKNVNWEAALTDLLALKFISGNHTSFEKELSKRCTRMASITPPLNSQQWDIQPSVPGPDIRHTRRSSESSSHESSELRTLEREITEAGKDSYPPTLPTSDLSIPQTPEVTTNEKESRMRLYNFKAEGPPALQNSPAWCPIRPDERELHISAVETIDLTADSLTDEDDYPDTIFLDQKLSVHHEGRSGEGMRRVEQKRLDEVDTAARVPIPAMDFSIPEVLWPTFTQNATEAFRCVRMTYGSAFSIPRWRSGGHKEAKMLWMPLRHGVGRVRLEEEFGLGDPELKKLLSFDTSVQTSTDFAKKKPGLAILRREDIENDPESNGSEEVNKRTRTLEQASRQTSPQSIRSNSIDRLVQKRKADMEASKGNEILKRHKADSSGELSIHSGDRQLCMLPGANEQNASGRLLLASMQTSMARGRKTSSNAFAKLTESFRTEASRKSSGREARVLPTASPVRIRQRHKDQPPAPCPLIAPLPKTTRVIFSLSIDQKLGRRIADLLPEAEFFDRDFGAHDSAVRTLGAVGRRRVGSELAFEADIIVSPQTGIIITSLLKVRQKPLPGSRADTQLRERIRRVGRLYERLIVLVSEANHCGDFTDELSPAEISDLANFVAFTTTLEASTAVHFVGGATETLAKWAASCIAQHAAEASEAQVGLMAYETNWEVFLRWLGMNTYAAQGLIAALKGKFGDMGLVGFCHMSAEERIERFARWVGGKTALVNLSHVMESH